GARGGWLRIGFGEGPRSGLGRILGCRRASRNCAPRHGSHPSRRGAHGARRTEDGMRDTLTLPGLLVPAVDALLFLFKSISVLNEYERAVTFWLGRLGKVPKGPGLVLIFWPFERMVRMSLRTVAHDVPAQDIITRDNVSVKVNAVVYFRVVEPEKAVVQVENYL